MSATVTAGGLLAAAVRAIRARPRALALPFVVAGVVVTVTGALRLGDPVPVLTRPSLQSGTVHVALRLYPTGIGTTLTEPGALVHLRPAYLVWVAAVGLVEWVAVTVAGVVVLAQVGDWRPTRGRITRYAAYVLFFRAVTGFSWFDVDVNLLLGIPLLVAVFVVAVRLFAVPGFLIAGRSLGDAVGESASAAADNGISLAAILVALGLASHALASVPTVGVLLSYALVGPVHAAAVALFVRRSTAASAPTGPTAD